MKYSTGKRGQILAFLSDNCNKSFTLTDIADAIAKDGHGRSTVYRIVSELTEEGLIKRLSDDKTRHIAYQYIGSEECRHHLHLKCRDCGILIHLDHKLSHIFSDAVASSGFSIEDGTMIFGKCDNCKGKVT